LEGSSCPWLADIFSMQRAGPHCDFEECSCFSLKSVLSLWFSIRLAAGGLEVSVCLSLES
jgi:hypothetical protein